MRSLSMTPKVSRKKSRDSDKPMANQWFASNLSYDTSIPIPPSRSFLITCSSCSKRDFNILWKNTYPGESAFSSKKLNSDRDGWQAKVLEQSYYGAADNIVKPLVDEVQKGKA